MSVPDLSVEVVWGACRAGAWSVGWAWRQRPGSGLRALAAGSVSTLAHARLCHVPGPWTVCSQAQRVCLHCMHHVRVHTLPPVSAATSVCLSASQPCWTPRRGLGASVLTEETRLQGSGRWPGRRAPSEWPWPGASLCSERMGPPGTPAASDLARRWLGSGRPLCVVAACDDVSERLEAWHLGGSALEDGPALRQGRARGARGRLWAPRRTRAAPASQHLWCPRPRVLT